MSRPKLKLYNVSFGILFLLPPGWAVIVLVLILESFIMSKYLVKKWYLGVIWLSAMLSNLVSGAIGVVLSLICNVGWWLV